MYTDHLQVLRSTSTGGDFVEQASLETAVFVIDKFLLNVLLTDLRDVYVEVCLRGAMTVHDMQYQL